MCTTDRERLEWQFVEAISEVMGDLGRLHMLTRNPECSLENRIKIAALCVFFVWFVDNVRLYTCYKYLSKGIYYEEVTYKTVDISPIMMFPNWKIHMCDTLSSFLTLLMINMPIVLWVSSSTPYLLQNLHSPASNFRIKISRIPPSPLHFLESLRSTATKRNFYEC